MKTNNLIFLIYGVIIITVALSFFSYVLDCTINFQYAIKKVNFLALYFVDFLIFHSWIFTLCIILYYYFFKLLNLKKAIIIKCVFGLIVGFLLSRILFKDEFSLIIGELKQLKVTTAYCLAAITSILLMELCVMPKISKKQSIKLV